MLKVLESIHKKLKQNKKPVFKKEVFVWFKNEQYILELHYTKLNCFVKCFLVENCFKGRKIYPIDNIFRANIIKIKQEFLEER